MIDIESLLKQWARKTLETKVEHKLPTPCVLVISAPESLLWAQLKAQIEGMAAADFGEFLEVKVEYVALHVSVRPGGLPKR